MATNKRLTEFKNMFERNVVVFKNLKTKQLSEEEELNEVETRKLKDLETQFDEVMKEPKTLAELPISTNIAISKFDNIIKENTTIFTYTPVASTPKNVNNNTSSNVETDKSTLLVKHEKVSNGMAIGITKDSLGVVDDLLNYTGQPTLKIQTLNTVLRKDTPLTTDDLGNTYSISFVFRLNRFPSKAYFAGNRVKRIITRRTDLLAFEYMGKHIDDFGGCKIEFGAMAPFGRYVKNQKEIEEAPQQQYDENGNPIEPKYDENGNPINTMVEEILMLEYKNKYSPFSIAAHIQNNNFAGSTSIYTDYKFELGKEYHVTLSIVKLKPNEVESFGVVSDYGISLSVDNVSEKTAILSGKAWGKNFNGAKASKPKFLLAESSEYLRQQDDKKWGEIYNAERHRVKLGYFDVRLLKTITSPPNIIKTDNNVNQKTFAPNTFKSNKSIVRKHFHKINNGVDIGAIEITTGNFIRKAVEAGAPTKKADINPDPLAGQE